MDTTPGSQPPQSSGQSTGDSGRQTTLISDSTTHVSTRPPASPFIQFIRIFLLVLIVVGIGLLLTQKYWVPALVAKILGPSSEVAISSPVATNTSLPVIIYAEQTNTDQYATSTFTLWRKIGSSTPEMLASGVTLDGAYSNYTLSPNRKLLSIAGRQGLQILNLDTKQLQTIYVPKNAIDSGTFSPDSSKIAFIESKPNDNYDKNGESDLYSFDLATGANTLLRKENLFIYDHAYAWRPDGKILVGYSRAVDGFDLTSYYYDPASPGKIHDVSTPDAYPINEDGTRFAYPTDNFDDCDIQSATDIYRIFDAVASTTLGTVGLKGTAVEILAISPDNSKVLFRSYPLISASDCENGTGSAKIAATYYVQQVGQNTTPQLVDPQQVLASWHADTINAIDPDGQPDDDRDNQGLPSSYSIWRYEDLSKIVSSTHPLYLVAQYYQ